MIPDDKHLQEALDDLLIRMEPQMLHTSDVVIDGMRRRNKVRRYIVGGGTALAVSLLVGTMLFAPMTTGVDDPVSDPQRPTTERVVTHEAHEADMASENGLPAASEEMPPHRTTPQQKNTVPVLAPAADSQRIIEERLRMDRDEDGFIEESTRISSRAMTAVHANDLIQAVQSYKGLAGLCAKRAHWIQSVAAYDSALVYANMIGDDAVIHDLRTRRTMAAHRRDSSLTR